MKYLMLSIVSIFFASTVLAAPSNTMSIPNNFVANTTIQSSKTNDNNNEIQSKYNAHSHTDITGLGTITSGTWNGTAITTQYGGTGNDFSAIASGATLYFNGTGTTTTLAKGSSGSILHMNALTQTPAWLSPGTAGYFLKSNGPSANPSWSAGGSIEQIESIASGGMITTTATIPWDDTILQFNEGAAWLDLTFTPTSASSTLRIDVVMNYGVNSANEVGMGLFIDNGPDAVAMSYNQDATAACTQQQVISYIMTAGTTSPMAFHVRGGANVAGTITLNGNGGNRLFAGTMGSTIIITEYGV